LAITWTPDTPITFTREQDNKVERHNCEAEDHDQDELRRRRGGGHGHDGDDALRRGFGSCSA
jgi:hypothetical protein